MLRLEHDLDAVRRCRRAIVEQCADLLPPALIDDLTLIASELVTNAVTHGDHGVVTIHVSASRVAATLTVTSASLGPRPQPPATWTLPTSDVVGGRGLALVSQLSSQVELVAYDRMVGAPGVVAIVATIERADSGP